MKPYSTQTVRILGSFDNDNFVKVENEKGLHKDCTVVYNDTLDPHKYINEIENINPHSVSVYSRQFVKNFNIKIKDNPARIPSRYSLATLIKLMETADQNIKADIKK